MKPSTMTCKPPEPSASVPHPELVPSLAGVPAAVGARIGLPTSRPHAAE